MKEQTCKVIENSNIKKDYYLIKIEAPYVAENALPGNFVMLTASGTADPLLKRPFGIFDVQGPYIWLYYEVIGKGTERIAALHPGDTLQLLGPLGNRFPESRDKNVLMVAGGRGIAPIYYTIKDYAARNNVYLIYGARSKDDLNLLDMLGKLPLKGTFLYTDDGSAGKKGFVTSDIKEIIEKNKIEITASCGPDAMFESLWQAIGQLPVQNYVSMEALMGCGFGICYSCAVKSVSGDFRKVCTDGPVFKMEEIQW